MDELDASAKKRVIWASVVGYSGYEKNTSVVQLFAKKVTDAHRKLTLEREVSLRPINTMTSRLLIKCDF